MDPAAISGALLRALRPGPPSLEVLGEVPREVRSVALVAGSFDPMTAAHAALAEALGEADLVLLAYSPRTMPKPDGAEPPLLTPERRVAAIVAWCASRPGFAVGVSTHGLYADQVEAVGRAFPGAEVVLGLGSDKVLQLFDPAWYEDQDRALERLFRSARIAHAPRSDLDAEVARTLARHPRWAGRFTRVELPEALRSLSSGQVRARLRRGEDAAGLVPPEVMPFLPAPGTA